MYRGTVSYFPPNRRPVEMLNYTNWRHMPVLDEIARDKGIPRSDLFVGQGGTVYHVTKTDAVRVTTTRTKYYKAMWLKSKTAK
jgi:hypothetical protein